MNKIKKFGALVLALMLLVSGFGNLGTVLAEDASEEIDWATDPETATDDQYVKFEDENFKYLVSSLISDENKDTIKKNKKELTVGEVRSIKTPSISLTNTVNYKTLLDGIRSYSGVEFMTNLEGIEIDNYGKGSSLDFSYLKNLKKLKYLTYYGKQLDDFDVSKSSLPTKVFYIDINHLSNIFMGKINIDTKGYKGDKSKVFTYFRKNEDDPTDTRENPVYATFNDFYNMPKNTVFLDKAFHGEYILPNTVKIIGSKIDKVDAMYNKVVGTLNLDGNMIYDIRPIENAPFIQKSSLENQNIFIKPQDSLIESPIKVKSISSFDISKVTVVENDISGEDGSYNEDFPGATNFVEINDNKLSIKKGPYNIMAIEFKYSNSNSVEYTDKEMSAALESFKKTFKKDKDFETNYVESIGYDKDINDEEAIFLYLKNWLNSIAKNKEVVYSGTIYIDTSNIKWDNDIFNEKVSIIKKLVGQEISDSEYKKSIINLPNSISDFKIISKVDTNTIGNKMAIAKVTFNDNSTKKINISVNVFNNKSEIAGYEISNGNINAKKEIIPWGGNYDLIDNIIGITNDMGITNRIDITEPKINTKEPGNYVGKVKLVFDDGSELIVDVPVKVKGKSKPNKPVKDADIYEPEGKDLTVNVGDEPKAEDAITNKSDLPEGTKYEWKETPDTTKPVSEDTIVVVTYPDSSKDEVTIKIIVKEDIPLTPLTPAEEIEESDKDKDEGNKDNTNIVDKKEDKNNYIFNNKIERSSVNISNIITTENKTKKTVNIKKPNKVEEIPILGNRVQEKLETGEQIPYIKGYPNENFGPNDKVTRAEVAAIFSRLSKDKRANNVVFKDVKNTDWFNEAVKIGISQGFIKGYNDGTFKPYKPITRAEFASVITTYANKVVSTNKFSDVNSQYKEAIDTAYMNGWMQGDGNKFRPNDPLTRVEAVIIINRMLKRTPNKEKINNAIKTGEVKSYKDISFDKWYSYDIYEASWGYLYQR